MFFCLTPKEIRGEESQQLRGFCPPKSLLPATQWRSQTLQQALVRFFVRLSPEKKRSKGPYMEFDPLEMFLRKMCL